MRAAVLGAPIAHSLSPVLHTAAYAALGLDGWTYEAIECDAAGLPGLLDTLGPEWSGLSLTMPLKRAVLPLLDQAEPLVAEVGGANTLIFGTAGRQGFNTDVPGMITALAEAGVATAPDALILGAGATACAALAALRGMGTRQAAVAVRDPATAGPLLEVADRLGVSARLIPFGEAGDPGGRRLLISTVPAGAAESYAKRIASRALIPQAILDVVYHPWPTPLAVAARQAGVAVVSGFDLLMHQAAGQVRLMTGQDAPIEAMRTAGLAALALRDPRRH
ncbi:MAG: shikimate dehydrogenase [Streptosporangiaceae bacterium]